MQRERKQSQRYIPRASDSEETIDIMETDDEVDTDGDSTNSDIRAFIDDDEYTCENRSVYTSSDLFGTSPGDVSPRPINDIDFDQWSPIPDEELEFVPNPLREIRHETPPEDDENFGNGEYFGMPCKSVFVSGSYNYLIDDKYINTDKHNLFIKNLMCNVLMAPMGAGKTTVIKKAVDCYRSTGKPILYISCTKNLCLKTSREFGIAYYIDVPDLCNTSERESISICINSLWKLHKGKAYEDYGMIIIDEIVGVIDMILGSLIKPRNRKVILDILMEILDPRHKRCVILSDALVGEREIAFIRDNCKVPKQQVQIWRFFPKELSRNLPDVVFVRDKKTWLRYLVKELTLGLDNRIFLCTAMREHVTDILTLFQNQDPDLLAAIKQDITVTDALNGQNWYVVTANTDPDEVRALLSDDTRLDDKDRFFYTPVIQSGVSFSGNKPYNVGFALGAPWFSAESLAQMIRRIRCVIPRPPQVKPCIYVCIPSGGDVAWLEGTELRDIKKMIKDYNKLDSKKKHVLASLLNIQVNVRSRVLTDYFTDCISECVLDLQAYTVKRAVAYRKDTEKYFHGVIKMNDPNWHYRVDQAEIVGGAPVDSKVVRKWVEDSCTTWITGVIQSKEEQLQCSDPDAVKEGLASYFALGIHPLDTIEVDPNAVRLPLTATVRICVERTRMATGVFNLFHQALFAVDSGTEGNMVCLQENYNIGLMVRGLFVVFRDEWRDHIKVIRADNGKELVYPAIDVKKLDTLNLDTVYILCRWKPLVNWMHANKMVLNAHSIGMPVSPSGGLLGVDEVPKASSFTAMRDLIVSVMGLLGMKLDLCNNKYMTVTRGGSRGATRNRKRMHLRTMVSQYESNASVRDSLPTKPAPTVSISITLSECHMKNNAYLDIYERAMRKDLQELMLDNRQRDLAYFFSFVPGDEETAIAVSKKIAKEFSMMLNSVDKLKAKEYMDSVAFWVLRDKTAALAFFMDYLGVLNTELQDIWNRDANRARLLNALLLSSNPE